MFSVQAVTHRYPGRRRQPPRLALDDLTLEIPAGAFCILAGPNGSGKSTLFRILCGHMAPSSGSVTVAGHDVRTEPARVRERLGVVFQSPAVDTQLSVVENLRLHGALYGLRGAALDERLPEAMDWSDLGQRLDERVETLSGGLRRQVELAKCLLTRPLALILDEPTTGLDPGSRMNFLSALHRIQREREMTVLMTSHIFDEAEDADLVAIMQEGRLLALDAPRTLESRLAQEMLVLESPGAEALAPELEAETGRAVIRRGNELRLDTVGEGEALPLLERVLQDHRPQITSIAIRKPGLEDVFVHLTRGGDGQ